MKDATLAIHYGYSSDPTTKAVAVPIYQTVAYEFDNAQHGADLFNLAIEGNIYSRIMNPTNDILEKRLAALEGGIAGLVLSSGSAAIHYAIQTIAKCGDNIVSTPQLYGGTYSLFNHTLPNYGINARFAQNDSPDAIAKLIDENTKAIFCETISNPSGRIADLNALAEVAHQHGIPLIVDNTVATPILCKPITYGADIVVHSITKYIGGHGNAIGGAIIDSGKFDWQAHQQRFPELSQPEPAYHGTIFTEAFGTAAFIAKARTVVLRNTGACLSPFNAFLFLQGLETLALRLEKQVQNTQKIATYLSTHPQISWVNYAGLPEHTDFHLAQKYTASSASAILSFGLKGGYDAAVQLHDQLKLFKRLVNIGDVRSLVCHPASTTHRQMTKQELIQANVAPELVRLSIGIEDHEDLIEDLAQALTR